jgi:hypothetical protein
MTMLTGVSLRIIASKQPSNSGTWAIRPKTDRAVWVHPLFTLLLFALAAAYRLACEREAMGGEPVGGHRWRRPRLEPTREQGIVCAQGH